MKIREFLKKDCPIVTTETRVDEVYEAINRSKCAVVLHEDGSVAGVLGSADMLKCTGGRIGHCYIEKPRVDSGVEVTEAIALMSAEGTDIVLVYDAEQFLGVVSIYDLARQLVSESQAWS